jgi:NADH-quinone oxidoreductase subunit K
MLLNFLQVGFILFTLGVLGIIVNRKNIILMLMSIELTLLSVNFLLIVFSVALDDLNGQLFSLFILCVAAAESAIGLSILVGYYKVRGNISVETINLIKG